MRLKDVPKYPAYVVSHDCFDRGAMEIWPSNSINQARNIANYNQKIADDYGYDDVNWRAYEKLPRCRVYKFHPIQ